MSTKYKFWDRHACYFVSFSVVEWIDIFTRNDYRTIVTDSLRYCIANKGLQLHAWVLMSNHVHLLCSLDTDYNNTLSDIMRDMKKFTSVQLTEAIRSNAQESRKDWLLYMFGRAAKYNPNNTFYQLWRQDNHPIEITGEKHFNDVLHYIHQNPVSAGWVDVAEHYPWSSARDYEGQPGLLPLLILD